MPKKTKYRYNPETLNYDLVEASTKDKFRKGLTYFAATAVFAVLSGIVALSIFPSTNEVLLERENLNLESNYNQLNQKMTQMEAWLQEIQEKDDYTYRLALEMDPVPEHKRKGGRGGYDRYKELKGYEYSDLVITTTTKIDELAKKLYVQSNSLDDIITVAKNKEKMLQSIPAIQPIPNNELKRMASGFGYRIHPVYKVRKKHTGMDFSAQTGTEIVATGDGVAEVVDADVTGYGKHIVINHGYGYKTLYGHMSKFAIKQGTKVKRGQVIGYVGSTGTSIAPHLHYEVIKKGAKINPINFYSADFTQEEYDEVRRLAAQPNQSFD